MSAGDLVPGHLKVGRDRGRVRAARVVLALVCVVVVATGCEIQHLRPEGTAPLRYRDEVFAEVTKTSNVPYGSSVNQLGETQTLLLDVYQPTGDTVTERPAIVWVHGGGFSGGNKSSPEIVDQANTFARKGYVTVSISYRLVAGGCSAGGVTPACIQAIVDAKHDAQAAVRFLRAHEDEYNIDTDRIAIGGSSAGAITALNVGYGSEDVGSSGNPGYPSTVDAAVSLSGAALLSNPTAGDAAALLFHGTSDFVVPFAWAQNTIDRAEAAGMRLYLTSWEGAGHVPYVAHRTEILDQTTNFLYHEMMLGLAAR